MNMTIDPKQVTNFDRTDDELELFWLFCIMVAGKNSDTVSKKLATMMKPAECSNMTPFEYLRWVDLREGGIEGWLKHHKAGQYNRLAGAFKASIYFPFNIRNCSLADLMSVPGVGPKTARFFMLHSRKDCTYAILDTHILRWMKWRGFTDVPTVTPQNESKYKYWADITSAEIQIVFPKSTMAEADLFIWKMMSGRA